MKFIYIIFLQIIFAISIVQADTNIYHGYIQKYPITMELLLKKDKTITGNYFYDKYKKKIHFVGNYDKNKIVIQVKDKKAKVSEVFEGEFSKNQIIGIWKQKKIQLPFEVFLENNIDVFEDKKITCNEMKAYPNFVFMPNNSIDLGSGNRSPIDVDYSCEGGLDSLEFLKNINMLSESIRSEGYSSCSGSIVHAHRRYYKFGLLKAGLAPDILKKHSLKKAKSTYSTNRDVKKYFTLWGHQSLDNLMLYEEYWNEYNKVFPLLSKHFQETFSVEKEEANIYTKYALKLFLLRAAGSFSSYIKDGNPDISALEKVIINPKNSLKELNEELLKQNSQEDLDQGLKVAMLYNKSINYINLLLKKGANINSGDESALFFALKNKKLFDFLLEKGADIDYENSFGKTVLYYAIGFNNLELTKSIIENGANINHTYIDFKTRDKLIYNSQVFYKNLCSLRHTKRTPLMHAAQNADISIVKYLIAHGSNKYAVDDKEYNVLDYANMGKIEENINYLKSIGFITKRTYWR